MNDEAQMELSCILLLLMLIVGSEPGGRDIDHIT